MDDESRLWVAVLAQAADDLTGHANAVGAHASREMLQRDAEDWLSSRDNTPGSFLWIADSLGIDANYARSRIMRYASAGQAKMRRLRSERTTMGQDARVHRRPRRLELASAQAG